MPPIDFFLNAHSQYYISFDFRDLLKRSGFRLDKLVLAKEKASLEGGVEDVLVLKAIVVELCSGMVCYPIIYPRYYTETIDERFLGECDSAYIRFSIFYSKTGFFSPLWETVIKGREQFTPNGYRIDWDVMQGKAPRMTQQQYYFLKEKAKKSTHLENKDVVDRTLPIWLESTAIVSEDFDPGI